MTTSAKRKCLHCQEFFRPDHRNLHQQRYCSKLACRRQSKAESQRRWLQKPENQNYFRGPDNCQRVKDWRKCHPGYWRKKKSGAPREPLQEVCRVQATQSEELSDKKVPDALQDLLEMQPLVIVGLISTMTGSALQEDIAATTRVLLRKGQDILAMRPGELSTKHYENQTATLSGTVAAGAAPV